jgi:hypothetical protein
MYTYVEDINRLVSVAEKFGYYLTKRDAEWVWEEYSNSYAAGWLIMDGYSDQTLLNIILSYMDV